MDGEGDRLDGEGDRFDGEGDRFDGEGEVDWLRICTKSVVYIWIGRYIGWRGR